jgi:DNA-directed RNA polymerase subunit RPC12/RpoP
MLKNSSSIQSLIERYRIEVYCFNCGARYITRLLDGKSPRKCKYCNSIKLDYVNRWRIDK